jgi:citrate lyase beta subunit
VTGAFTPLRSVLYLPGSNERALEKAKSIPCDALILDLEDAVAPDEKPGARGKIVRAIKELDWRGRPTLYRANALDTPYFYRDLIEVIEEAGDGLDAVMVPKVNHP